MFIVKETVFIVLTVFILVSCQASDRTSSLNSVNNKTSSGGSQSKQDQQQEEPMPPVNEDACPSGLCM